MTATIETHESVCPFRPDDTPSDLDKTKYWQHWKLGPNYLIVQKLPNFPDHYRVVDCAFDNKGKVTFGQFLMARGCSLSRQNPPLPDEPYAAILEAAKEVNRMLELGTHKIVNTRLVPA